MENELKPLPGCLQQLFRITTLQEHSQFSSAAALACIVYEFARVNVQGFG
jgi:hypothetical protein